MGGKGTQYSRTFVDVILGGEAWMLSMSTASLPLQVKDPVISQDR